MPDTPAPPPPFPPFKNPWATLPQTSLKKNSLVVSLACEQALQRICPKYGVIQTTISILLSKLLHELERNNINSYNPDGYAVAIAGCRIQLGGIIDPSNYTTGYLSGASPTPIDNGSPGIPTPVPPTRRKRTRTSKAPSGNDGRGA